jgi:hyperosmotically inducible protein
MPNHFLRIAALLGASSALAACDRAGEGSANFAMFDAAARNRAQSVRTASDLYPSATPAAAHPTATAPRYDPLSREALSDTMIARRIKGAILADPGMAGADVSVDSDAGVVSLTGTVKSQEQAAIASAHAQHYDGVMRIDNHLSTLPQ